MSTGDSKNHLCSEIRILLFKGFVEESQVTEVSLICDLSKLILVKMHEGIKVFYFILINRSFHDFRVGDIDHGGIFSGLA